MFDPSKEYIEEVLFRGRPPGDPRPSAYQVTVGENDRTQNQRILNVEQAIAEGLDLSTLVPGLNSKALADSDAIAVAHDQMLGERDAAVQRANSLQGLLDAATDRADSLLDQLNRAVALRGQDEVNTTAAAKAASDEATQRYAELDASWSTKSLADQQAAAQELGEVRAAAEAAARQAAADKAAVEEQRDSALAKLKTAAAQIEELTAPPVDVKDGPAES